MRQSLFDLGEGYVGRGGSLAGCQHGTQQMISVAGSFQGFKHIGLPVDCSRLGHRFTCRDMESRVERY